MFNLFNADSGKPAPKLKGVRLAMIADASFEDSLVDWAYSRVALLTRFEIQATSELAARLRRDVALEVKGVAARNAGGDIQLAAEVAKGRIAALFCFPPAAPGAVHEFDSAMLIRAAMLKGTPIALNRATAELLATSPLFTPDGEAHALRRPTPLPDELANEVP